MFLCVYARECSDHKYHWRALDPFKLELQAIVVLGTELCLLQEPWGILPAPGVGFIEYGEYISEKILEFSCSRPRIDSVTRKQ